MPTSRIAASYDSSMFNILRNYQTVSQKVHHFTFPPATYEASDFSTFLSTVVIVHSLKINPYKEMWSGFDFHFSPGSSAGKESACITGDPGLIPGLGRSPEEGMGYPLQYSWASLVAQTVKNPPAMWDLGSIPGLGRSPGGGHGNPLQYSCLENPHGQRSLAGYNPWGHKESDTTEQQSTAQWLMILS